MEWQNRTSIMDRLTFKVFYSSTDKGYDAISLHHTRKTAALYNTKEASVFKLSRLRVPRYRHFMQTASFAVVPSYVVSVF
jgi:hypothetical protein